MTQSRQDGLAVFFDTIRRLAKQLVDTRDELAQSGGTIEDTIARAPGAAPAKDPVSEYFTTVLAHSLTVALTQNTALQDRAQDGYAKADTSGRDYDATDGWLNDLFGRVAR